MWDFVVVGSGFGGSVSALRLVEKGHRVLLLEKGRRFAPDDFPRSNWRLGKWLWAPRLGLRGPFRMDFLRHLTALSGVGVGGGSLVYANVLAEPEEAFFSAPPWGPLACWREELAPHYARARVVLGATPYPAWTWPDEVLGSVARDLGIEDRHRRADVAVWFGEPGVTVADPYFGGEGPERTGCTACGGCMLGCRHGAKNTLDRNYLHLAERRGLTLLPEHEATWVRPVQGGYEVEALEGVPGVWRRRRRATFRARRVVLAGGVLGTVPLLLRLRDSADGLPRLSPRLGELVRTNSEALVGVVSGPSERSASEGVAITSVLRTDARSALEPVRFPAGSGFFRLLMTPHATGATLAGRLGSAARRVLRDPAGFARALLVADHGSRTIILLYMRSVEGHLSLVRGRLGGRARTVLALGAAPSAWIPEASELAERVADKVRGFPASLATETLLGRPTTAHLLGGCAMGDSPATGVIDPDHQVHGYPGLYVVDGSSLSANPGVNPSLTIAALAERAMARMG